MSWLPLFLALFVALLVWQAIRIVRRQPPAPQGQLPGFVRAAVASLVLAVVLRLVLVCMEATLAWDRVLPDMLFFPASFVGEKLSWFDRSAGVFGEQVYPLVAGVTPRSDAVVQANMIINIAVLLGATVLIRSLRRRSGQGSAAKVAQSE